jgi:O-antigen ligase
MIWLFSTPILNNSDLSITIPFVGFNLTSSRLLFFGMLPQVALYLADRVRNSKFKYSYRFELVLVAYFFTLVIAQFINIQEIQLKFVLNNLVAALTFVFIYFLAKWQITQKDIKVLKQAFLLFGIISGIVGIIQFTIDPYFLRFGDTRSAFGSFLRSNGLNSAEHIQGAIMVIALIITHDLYKNVWIKFGLSGLFTVAAFFTMHRLTWVIFSMVAIGILGFNNRKKFTFLIYSTILFCLIGIMIFINFEFEINRAIANSDFSTRLFSDTLSGRIAYYVKTPDIVRAYPLGIGDYTNSGYLYWAIDSGILSTYYSVTVIHNGLLATLVKFGIVGLICFVIFYAYVIAFSLDLYKTKHKTGLFLLLLCVVYLGYNATNDYSFSTWQNLSIILNLFLGSIVGIESRQLRKL